MTTGTTIRVNQVLRGLEWEVVHPLGSDGQGPWLPVSSEYAAVLQNLPILLLVEPGEWLMRPLLGSPLAFILDDPTSDTTLSMARTVVRTQITEHEPRLELTRVTAEFGTAPADDLVQLVIGIFGVVKVTGERLAVRININFDA